MGYSYHPKAGGRKYTNLEEGPHRAETKTLEMGVLFDLCWCLFAWRRSLMGPGPRHLKRGIEQLQLIEAGSASVKHWKLNSTFYWNKLLLPGKRGDMRPGLCGKAQEANKKPTASKDTASPSSSTILTAPSAAFYWSRLTERQLGKANVVCKFPALTTKNRVLKKEFELKSNT